MSRRTDPKLPELPAWRCLRAGIPLTLLLDLAAGPGLDSVAILQDEEVAGMVIDEWAAAAEVERGARSRDAASA